jgi:hypothetical protein
MVERRIALIFLLLLVVPAVSAFDVTKVWVDWNGNEVKTIAPETPLSNARMAVRFSPDIVRCNPSACSVRMDASSLSLDTAVQTVLRDMTVPFNNACKNITGSWVCYSPTFTLTSKTASHQITYRRINGSRVEAAQTTTIPLTLDTTRPRVALLRTGLCEDNVCYASTGAPTLFTVTFEDTVTSFNYRLVFVGNPSQNIDARVTSCSGKTCTGTVTLSCQDGEERQIRIIDGNSREDALNLPVESPPVRIICTSRSPEILEWQQPKSDGPLPVPFSTGAITAKAKVRVFKGKPNATVNTQDINNISVTQGRCVESDGDTWECTWQIANLNPGKFELEFRVADAVGNYYLAPKGHAVVIEVLERTVPEGTRIDYFDAVVPKDGVQPEALNRMVIDLARANYMPYPLYVTYDVTRKKAGVNIVHQELKGCWYKLGTDTNQSNYTTRMALFSVGGARSESRVFMPSQQWDKQNRLDLQSRAARDVLKLADEFDVKCQIDFTVAEGGKILTIADSNNITFKVKLRESPLGQPGQAFVTKIEEETEKLNSGKAKTVMQLEGYRQKADKVCQGYEKIAYVQQVGGALKVTAGVMGATGYLEAAGLGLDIGSAAPMITQLQGFMDITWNGRNPMGKFGKAIETIKSSSGGLLGNNIALGGSGGPAKQLCRQVNCRVYADAQSEMTPQRYDQMSTASFVGSQVTGAAPGSGIKGVISANNIANPEKSLVGAISTMCLGGVIYNLQKDVAIDCQYLACLKEQSTKGASVAVCQRARSYNICKQVVGEMGELPYVRVFKNLADNLNHVLTNLPYVLAEKAFYNTCSDKLGATGGASCSGQIHDWKCIGCQFTNSLLQVVDAQKQTNKAMAGIPNAGQTSVCDVALTDKKAEPTRGESITDYAAREAARQRDLQGRAQSDPDVQKAVAAARNLPPNIPQPDPDSDYETEMAQISQLPAYQSYTEFSQSLAKLGISTADLSPEQWHNLVNVADGSGMKAQQEQRLAAFLVQLQNTPPEKRKDELNRYMAAQEARGALSGGQFDNSRQDIQRAVSSYYACQEKGADNCKDLLDKAADGVTVSCNGDTCTITRTTGCTENCETTINGKLASEYSNKMRSQAMAALASEIGTYAAKWLADKGYYDSLRLDLPFIKDLTYDELTNSICNEQYSISENDDGAIYSQAGAAIPVAFFGTERRLMENSSGRAYNYITLMYLTNPQRGVKLEQKYNYTIDIVFTDLKSCLAASCPADLSLLKADANLPEGQAISNGNGPRTHIIYLPGEYERICVRFNKAYPDESGRKTYCRPIAEEVFDTGSPVLPPATGTAAQSTRPGSSGQPGTTTPPGSPPVDPWGGWS